jgi:hypothetical protein
MNLYNVDFLFLGLLASQLLCDLHTLHVLLDQLLRVLQLLYCLPLIIFLEFNLLVLGIVVLLCFSSYYVYRELCIMPNCVLQKSNVLGWRVCLNKSIQRS